VRSGKVKCRSCGTTVTVFEDEIGTTGKCPKCGAPTTVGAEAFSEEQQPASKTSQSAASDVWDGDLELEVEEPAPTPAPEREVVVRQTRPQQAAPADFRVRREGRGRERSGREEEGPGMPLWLFWFLDLFPGLIRPVVLIMSLLMLPVAAVVCWLGFFILTLGAIFAGFATAGFGLIIYWSALAWIIYGYISLPSEALAEFDSRKWTAFLLLALAPVGLGLFLIARPR
jgi:hypothetical protein